MRRRIAILLRPLLALLSLLFVFALGEAYFRFVHDQSDGFGDTYAARRWHERYYNPINAHRFRDIEWDFETAKPRVVVLGDSFMEGAGIETIDDRLSGVLRRLRPDLAIYNVARAAWDTRAEYHALAGLPIVPDVLIFSYYLNDIEVVYRPILPRLEVKSWIVQRSAFVNYVYWQLRRRDEIFREYAAGVQAAYEDPVKLRAHLSEVQRILGFAADHDTRLIVLLFPVLTDLDSTAYRVMKDYFLSEGVELISVGEVIDRNGLSLTEIIVNRSDAHPSVLLHRLLAELLAEEL